MQNLKVAYILHRFPYLTETFIMREIDCLRRLDVDVEIFSLLRPRHSVIHDQAHELLSLTHYSPFVSWSIVKAQLFYLVRSPWRYLNALRNVVRQSAREPGVFLRSMVLFPKSVSFARSIKAQQFDHIHSHFVWIDAIAAGVVSDLTGITFSIHPHAFGLFGRNQKSVKNELEHAAEVVTISEYHRNYIQRLCPDMDPDRIHVVYCALDTELLKPEKRRSDASTPMRILSVGRMVEKKGFEYLVAACHNLAERGTEFECHIVGSGSGKEQLQKQIHELGLQDHVHLVGSLSQEQILDYYRESDIFALPCVIARDGDRDGIPVVLMEAMACEVPVVTTPVTGIPDLVTDREAGLLVEERIVEELTGALTELISDGDLRRRLGARGRQIIVEKFEIRKNIEKLAAIFRHASGKPMDGSGSDACIQNNTEFDTLEKDVERLTS